MAKKRFNTADNPALSYMTGAELEAESEKAHAALSPDGEATYSEIADIGEHYPGPEAVREIVERIRERGVTPEDAAQLARLYEIGKEAGRREAKPETKSKRLNLLLKPSTFEGITAIAKARGTSVNDYINIILEQTIKAEREQEG